MTINDLLALMEREQQTLSDDNYHSASAIMREAAAKLRMLANHIGGKPQDLCSHGVRADCTACEPLARLRHR